MRIKHIIALSAAMAMMFGTASAHTHLTVNKDTDSEKHFSFAELSKINFKSEGLEFVTDSPTLIDWADIVAVHFNSPLSGIETLPVDSPVLSIYLSADRQSLRVEGYEPGNTLEIFSINGRKMVNSAGYDGRTFSITSLPSGIYILKIGNSVKKFAK